MNDEGCIISLNRNGTPSVRGTRLTIFSIMEFYLAGEKAGAIAGIFGISVEDALAAIAYIDRHREKLMPDYAEISERNRRGNSAEVEARFAESHRKLMRLRAVVDPAKTEAAKAGGIDSRLAG